MRPSKGLRLVLLISFLLGPLAAPSLAGAGVAGERIDQFFAALKAGDYAKAENHFSPVMRQSLPPAKLKSVWKQLTGEYGPLKSFQITQSTEAQGAQLRIVNLDFESGSGLFVARIAFDSLDDISGLYFAPGTGNPNFAKVELADKRANELVAALRIENFQAAEAHFDATMKTAFPPEAFENAWHQRTASLGALKGCLIAERGKAGASRILVVNLSFEKAVNAFALRISIGPTGEITGLYFVNAIPPPLHITPSAFRSLSVTVGSGPMALGGTLTMPVGPGPFPAAVMVQGSGPNDRDETIDANKPVRDIAEGLSSDGIAILRYDKRTYAHAALIDPLHITVDQEVIDDAVAAVGLLKRRKDINHRRIFVVGHSLGAMLAPEIAERAGGVAGVAMLAPPGRPAPRIIVYQEKYLGVPAKKLASDEKEAKLLMTKALAPTAPAFGASASYFYDLDSRDEIGIARKLGKPILILHGSRDYQVTDADIAAWRHGLRGVKDVKIKTIPGLNHLFIVGEGKPGPSEYMTPSHVSPQVVTILSSFIEASR